MKAHLLVCNLSKFLDVVSLKIKSLILCFYVRILKIYLREISVI